LQIAAQMVTFSRSNEPWEETDTWSLKNGTHPRELTYDSGKMAQSLRKKEWAYIWINGKPCATCRTS
jgi:hypothetical protein